MRDRSVDVELVVTDLDGTFWDQSGRAHPLTLRALSVLSSGTAVLAATGRRPSSAYAKMKANGFSLPAILFDGSLGMMAEDGPRFHRCSFDAELYRRSLDAFRMSGFEPVVNLDDIRSCGVGENPDTHPAHLGDNGDCIRRIDLSEAATSWDVLSLLICGGDDRLLDVFERVRGFTAASLTPDVRYGGLSLSVRPPGVTKWSGVVAYCRRHGIRDDRVLAVGDGVNDLELLRAARVACVPESACEEALAAATHVIGAPAKGGWADIARLIGADRVRFATVLSMTTSGSRRDPGRRRALLEAADRVIRREGPEASMAAIAAEAGVSKPILYRHFGDKSGLYQALAERHTRKLIEAIRAEFSRDDPISERTRATIGTYLSAISANPDLYRFLVHRAGAEDAATRGAMSTMIRDLGRELAEVLIAEGGPVDRTRALLWGHAIVGMVQTASDWWLDHPDEVSKEDVVDGLVELVLGGLPGGPSSARA